MIKELRGRGNESGLTRIGQWLNNEDPKYNHNETGYKKRVWSTSQKAEVMKLMKVDWPELDNNQTIKTFLSIQATPWMTPAFEEGRSD